MPRMRTLKPEAATSESLAELSRAVRWTFALLWTHCDDEGRAALNPKLIKAALYPLDDDVTADVITRELSDLERVEAVCIYEVDGKDYLHVPAWHEHQHPNRRVESKLPPCPGGDGAGHVRQGPKAASHTTQGARTEPAVSTHEQSSPVVVVVVGDVDGEGVGEGEATDVAPADAPRPPAAPTLSVNQRAQRLAKAYTDRVPMSRFPAIQGIAKKALEANYSDGHVEHALLRLAAEGRSVTVETLRIELDGAPPPSRAPRKRTADDRVRDGLELARQLAEQDSPPHRQIGA